MTAFGLLSRASLRPPRALAGELPRDRREQGLHRAELLCGGVPIVIPEFYVDRIGFKELPGFLKQMKEAARPQKSVTAQMKQAKEAALPVKVKKHKERDAR